MPDTLMTMTAHRQTKLQHWWRAEVTYVREHSQRMAYCPAVVSKHTKTTTTVYCHYTGQVALANTLVKKQWILLEQSFTACMPLLTATYIWSRGKMVEFFFLSLSATSLYLKYTRERWQQINWHYSLQRESKLPQFNEWHQLHQRFTESKLCWVISCNK